MGLYPLSFSKVNLINTCPRAAKWQYVDLRSATIKSIPFEIGNRVHLILQSYVDNIKVPKDNLVLSPKLLEGILHFKNKLLTRILNTYPQVYGEARVYLNNKFKRTDGFLNSSLMGVIDLLCYNNKTEEATVIDYKSSTYIDEDLILKQADFYSIISKECFPKMKHFNYLYYAVPLKKLKSIINTDDLSFIDKNKQNIVSSIPKLEKDLNQGTPKPGSFCSICVYRNGCDECQALKQ